VQSAYASPAIFFLTLTGIAMLGDRLQAVAVSGYPIKSD
jgi:hypothetical protein